MGRKDMLIILALLIMLVFGSSASAVNNPIHHNRDMHDCDVLKYNGEYYITGNWLNGDMYISRNLEDWGARTHVFSPANTWHTPQNDNDQAASHLRYLNGNFHFYTQQELTKATHAVSSDVLGPYIEPVLNVPFVSGIDVETYMDEDGSLYFYYTVIDGNERIYAMTMSNLWTLTGSPILQITPNESWYGSTNIDEGSKVFKYRNKYYMLYCAYPSGVPEYSIGCVEANSPTSFYNSGKYPYPVLTRATPPGSEEIAYIGQPWFVEGPNGFEKWMGYFASTPGEGRTQRIERAHFFDRTFYVEGPTNRYSTGYHPGPAKPQLLSLFNLPDGAMLSEDWTAQNIGSWSISGEEAFQINQTTHSFNTVNRSSAANYLIEANVKFSQAQDAEDKAGVIAYFQDFDNYVIVGFDRVLDRWYVHVRESGVDDVIVGDYNGSVNYNVYHKIRVTKNGSDFDVRIDDMIPPGFSTVNTNFAGAGIPGLFTDHASAAFDGIIYTIGWDEFDSGIAGWGGSISAVPETGTWSNLSNGITMSDGTGYTFKGDLMPEYQFSTQIYKEGVTDGSMGVFAVAIDGNNYLTAVIDMATDELVVTGIESGSALTEQRTSVGNANGYNIRVVKLSDKAIFFVNGQEVMTYNVSFGPSQVGLYVFGMSARFNGILAYQIEQKSIPAEWTVADVGAVGFAGSEDYNEGTYSISASGTDIWAQNDEFRYLYQDVESDWEITARVFGVDPVDDWSKASLMYRDSLAGNSAMVHIIVTPLNHVQLMWRNVAGEFTTEINVWDQQTPIWIKLKRSGVTFSGFYSLDGQNWILVGDVTPPFDATGKLGMAVTAHHNERIGGAVFDNVTLDVCANDVPAPWISQDVGAVNHDGCASYDSGVWDVTASGDDIWYNNDSFHFVYHPWNGDGEMVARITSMDDTSYWSKAGVMFRESMSSNSKHTLFMVNGAKDRVFHIARSTAGGASNAHDFETSFTLPYWIKLTRTGNTFRSYHSVDGVDWIYLGLWNIAMSQDIYVGLAVCSEDNNKLCHASFDNVRMPSCTLTIADGDLDGNCVVDSDDLHIFAGSWLSSNSVADIFDDGAGAVNLKDMAVMAQHWLDCGWSPSEVCN